MPRRTCPACPRRNGGLVDPECPVCDGVGVIGLGPAALYMNEPVVVARAIELYLEATCREDYATTSPGEERHDALVAAVADLREAGVIQQPIGVAEPEAVSNQPARVVAAEAARLATAMGARLRPADAANLDAPRIVYGPDDRPRASGLLPTTSAHGHQSFLARAADPTDALGPDTRSLVYAEQALTRRAHVISDAVTPAIAHKHRRSR